MATDWSQFTPVAEPSAPAHVDWSQFRPAADFSDVQGGVTKPIDTSPSVNGNNEVLPHLDGSSRRLDEGPANPRGMPHAPSGHWGGSVKAPLWIPGPEAPHHSLGDDIIDSFKAPTDPNKRTVGTLESAARDVVGAENSFVSPLSALPALPLLLMDAAKGVATGKNKHELGDTYFENVVKPQFDLGEKVAIDPATEQQSAGSATVGKVAGFVPTLLNMIAGGEATKGPEAVAVAKTTGGRALEFLQNALSKSARATAPVLPSTGAEQFKASLDAGQSTPEAAVRDLGAMAEQVGANAIPLAGKTRAGSAALGAVGMPAISNALSLLHGNGLQSGTDNAAQSIIGALTGGALGGEPAKAPDAPLGGAPEPSVTPAAASEPVPAATVPPKPATERLPTFATPAHAFTKQGLDQPIDLTPNGQNRRAAGTVSTITYHATADGVKITNVYTPKDARGVGGAELALRDFVAQTDKAGQPVELVVAGLGKGMDDARLKGLYERVGFEATGTNADGNLIMRRVPPSAVPDAATVPVADLAPQIAQHVPEISDPESAAGIATVQAHAASLGIPLADVAPLHNETDAAYIDRISQKIQGVQNASDHGPDSPAGASGVLGQDQASALPPAGPEPVASAPVAPGGAEPAQPADTARIAPEPAPRASEPAQAAAPDVQAAEGQAGQVAPEHIAGATHAKVDENRQARNEPPVESPHEPGSHAQYLADAKKLVADNPEHGKQLAEDVVKKGRATTPVEKAVLTLDAKRIETERRAATQAINDAIDSGDKNAEQVARMRLELARNEQDVNDVAIKGGGSETGAALEASKLMIGDDLELRNMIASAKANKGAELTDAERTRLEKAHDELQKAHDALKRQVEELQAGKAPKGPKKTVDELAQQRLRKRIADKRDQIKQRLKACPI